MSTPNEVILDESSKKGLVQSIVDGVKGALASPKPVEVVPSPPAPVQVVTPPAPKVEIPLPSPSPDAKLLAEIESLKAQLAEKSKSPPPTPAQVIVEPPKDPNEPTTMKERSDLLVAEFKALKPNEQLTWLTHILEFNAKQPRK